MQALLAQAHAQLTRILDQIEDAQALAAAGVIERAANLAHDADLACLATADLLSQAFGAAATRRMSG